MNVATITMDPEVARENRAYRKALHTRTDAEYEAAAKGYRALAAGTPLLHLGEVFRAWKYETAASLTVKVQMGAPLAKTSKVTYRMGREAFALIPMIPADVLPERYDPQTHFILWEVEQWSEERIGARPDRDPFLLRHLGGELYAIVAEWDLTDLERAIIAGTRASK